MKEQQRNYGELPAVGFIRQAELVKIVPFSSATIWRKIKIGEFPKPVKLSARVTAWPVQVIREWLEAHGA